MTETWHEARPRCCEIPASSQESLLSTAGGPQPSQTLPPPNIGTCPFYHDEKRELLICIPCGGVLFSSDRPELLKHLTTVHKDTTATFEKKYKLDMDLVLDEVSKIKVFKHTKGDRIRLASMGRVPYLPVQDGFKCNIPDCAGQNARLRMLFDIHRRLLQPSVTLSHGLIMAMMIIGIPPKSSRRWPIATTIRRNSKSRRSPITRGCIIRSPTRRSQ